jgi:two-component system, sensor histidine kinase
VDIGLPELDGYEVARRLRDALGNGPRLIALTGYGQPEDRRLSRDAGFDVHLVKPVLPDQLAAALEWRRPGAAA